MELSTVEKEVLSIIRNKFEAHQKDEAVVQQNVRCFSLLLTRIFGGASIKCPRAAFEVK